MARARHLENPPITEAIIDIKVEHTSPTSADQILPLHERIKQDYPEKQTRRMFAGQFGITKGRTHLATEDQVVGYAFNNTPKTQVAVYQIDGVSFSRLRPYTSWEDILPEFKKHWTIYVERFAPRAAVRIAGRHINAIEIPQRTFDLEEYFETPPKLPTGLPNQLEDFIVRMVVPFAAEGLKAIVTQAIGKATSPDALTIILDVDVVCATRVETGDPRIWEILERIHAVKNQIFFSSLKEKTVEMFEKEVKR